MNTRQVLTEATAFPFNEELEMIRAQLRRFIETVAG